MVAPLRRDLGLLDAVAVGLGAIIGAGIFVVTGVAASVAGPALIAGLLIAAIAATCNALSSAQLAARYPTSGGTYEYGYQVLNPAAGFAAGWTFLASKLAAGGTVALGFGSYLATFLPRTSPVAAGVGAVAALTVANLLGIRKAGRLNLAIVTVTVGSLVYFVLAGFPAVRMTNFQPFAPNGAASVMQSAAILFFAYTGYARIATLGEEVRDPSRTIPRAIVLSLAISCALYFSVASVAVGVLGAEALARAGAPLVEAARRFGGVGAGTVVTVGATTAMLGVLLSQVLGISRMMLAMARRRDLPPALAHVHPDRAVPDRAILLTGAIIALIAILGVLEWIVASASFAILLYYTITNLAALRMAPADKRFSDWVPRLGLLACLALAASLPVPVIASGLAVLAVGFAVRALFRGRGPRVDTDLRSG